MKKQIESECPFTYGMAAHHKHCFPLSLFCAVPLDRRSCSTSHPPTRIYPQRKSPWMWARRWIQVPMSRGFGLGGAILEVKTFLSQHLTCWKLLPLIIHMIVYLGWAGGCCKFLWFAWSRPDLPAHGKIFQTNQRWGASFCWGPHVEWCV